MLDRAALLVGIATIALACACGNDNNQNAQDEAVASTDAGTVDAGVPEDVVESCYGYGCPYGACTDAVSCEPYQANDFDLKASNLCPSLQSVDFCIEVNSAWWHVECSLTTEVTQQCPHGCNVDVQMGCACCGNGTTHGC